MDYQDARIAEVYDLANPWAQDADFYFSLAGPRPCRVLDRLRYRHALLCPRRNVVTG